MVARRPLAPRGGRHSNASAAVGRSGQDKEKQFIDKMKAAGKADVEAQLKRLSVPPRPFPRP